MNAGLLTSAQDEAIDKAIAAVKEKPLSLNEIAKIVAPPREAAKVPESIPLPAVISESQRKALEDLSHVYGQVVPAEKRALLPDEVRSLLTERRTLDEIEKLAKVRKDDIRTTVFNHFDVEAEGAGIPEGAEKDKDGHLILKGEVVVPGEGKFSRSVRSGSVSINPDKIKELGDDPEVEWITHEDYLACTTQVRVFDEEKAALLLRKKPELIRAIALASERTSSVAAFTVGKA